MILNKILETKRDEVRQVKSLYSTQYFESQELFRRQSLSLKDKLNSDRPGIIAEIKRRSPSKGELAPIIDPVTLAHKYLAGGAAAISVLTDQSYFGGSINDLLRVRESCNLPLLRKDFIIDPIQIYEAKASGADLILLIAAALTPDEITELSTIAHKIGLEVLLELHNLTEAKNSPIQVADIVGVNNRDLRTFEVDLNHSFEVAKAVPSNTLLISESGLSTSEEIRSLINVGFSGFLMGETLVRSESPDLMLSKLIAEIRP